VRPFSIVVNRPGFLPEEDPYCVIGVEEMRGAVDDEITRTVDAHDGPETISYAEQETAARRRAQELDEDGGVVQIGDYVIDVTPVSPEELALWAGDLDQDHLPVEATIRLIERSS
jgi:hypothetical protein